MHEFRTTMFFRCPKCGVSDTIEVEVPEFALSGDGFEHMSEGPIVIECTHCETELDGQAFCTSSGCHITMDEFPQYRFYGDPPAYSSGEEDYWLDYDPPEDPHRIFLETYHQLLSLLDQTTAKLDDPQLLSRMIFSQLVTAMEAYLADTLISHVVSDQAYTVELLSQDRSLRQERMSLLEIAKNPDIVGHSVKRYLRSILYHNLEKVRFLYRCSLDMEIAFNEHEWKLLLTAVSYRHDCVHRNGFTVDGKMNRIFTKTYVKRVAGAIDRLVRHVQMRRPSADDWMP